MEEQAKLIEATYRGGEITSPLSPIAQSYLSKGYGERDGERKLVKYSPVEALYLVEVGKMRVWVEDGGELGFHELLRLLEKAEPNLWRDYVVYRDLRRRRYVVKEGFGRELRFRVFERGEYGEKPARYVVAPLYEGRDVPVERLLQWLSACRGMRKELVLAVIDRRNEVIYYKASLVDLRNV